MPPLRGTALYVHLLFLAAHCADFQLDVDVDEASWVADSIKDNLKEVCPRQLT